MQSKHPVTIYFYPLLDEKIKDISGLFETKKGECATEYILYIHIPYCLSHCTFCPFNTKIIRDRTETKQYIESLCTEIDLVSSYYKEAVVTSVYYGGGSPSVLEPDDILKLHEHIERNFNIENAEISFEGELRTLTEESIIGVLNKMNVNRISMGIQTFDDKIRQMFNIALTSKEVSHMIYKLKSNSISRLNIDMMYGLPGHRVEELLIDLNKLISLEVDSIDYYRLHPYSLPFSQHGDWCEFADSQKELFITEIMTKLQLAGYENVCDQVYSREGLSKYSQLMWGNASESQISGIIGIGASARGYINGRSYMNFATVREYIDNVSSGKIPIEKVSEQRSGFERNFVFSPKYFYIPKKFNEYDNFRKIIERWENKGLIFGQKQYYYLTDSGKLKVDNMIIEAMSDGQYKLAAGIERNISGIENLRTGRF